MRLSLGGTVLVQLALLASCYSPTPYGDCQVRCSSGSCPSGLSCQAGMCRVEGFTGACGGVMQDGSTDTSAIDAADAAAVDTMCSHTCYGPSNSSSPVGSAACQTTPNGCQANNAWIDQIDFCTCSVGQPELYIQPSSASADFALVAPRLSPGSSYAMTIDNGVCYGTGAVCPASALAGCAQTSEVDGWPGIMITPGSHTYRFYNDDGTGCVGAVLFTFVVVL